MYLLDTNILIYSSKKDYLYLQDYIFMKQSAISFVTKNEIGKVKNYTDEDLKYFSLAFDSLQVIEFQKRILDASLLFQDRYKIDRNDSIIAATAFVNGLVLVSNDFKLFNKISGLKTLNPIK